MANKTVRMNLLIGIIMFLFIFLAACNQQTETISMDEKVKQSGDQTGKLVVYTSFYPLYDFAVKIAGNRAEVNSLISSGMDPHHFEPTPKDLVRLSEADLFIYNGSGFELWIEDVLQSLGSDLFILDTSEHVELLTHEETGNGHHYENRNEEDDDNHKHVHDRINDPHIWLDPLRAKEIAKAIKNALVQLDRDGKERYETNFEELAAEFDKLHNEYEHALNHAKRREIIVSHAAFGYLADRYGLKQISISGLSSSDEPSQKELQEIITFAEGHDVNYIFFETLAMSKVAEVVKEQIGADALQLNPLEGLTEEEMAKGQDYFSVMRDNLENLKIALGSDS